jgi:signal transduction histidine kinase
VARRIAREHGGDVKVHSEPGRGSDFTIELPSAG